MLSSPGKTGFSLLSAQRRMTGSSGTLALGTGQALKSGPTQNEGAEYFPHQTDIKGEI